MPRLEIERANEASIRRALRHFDSLLYQAWNFGRNIVVGWRYVDGAILVCVAPTSAVLSSSEGMQRVSRGRRLFGVRTFHHICRALGVRPMRIALNFTIGTHDADLHPDTIDNLVRRYTIVETEHRSVMLFDIVGFSKHSPLEQVVLLNSLEYSINMASQRMAELGLKADLARSTVGDGFYVWNRNKGAEADVNVYIAMMLILADNAIGRKDEKNLVPVLRTAFHGGPHYSYFQVEGSNPRGYEYIVGDVTIKLARMIGKALPGQILMGDFTRPRRTGDRIRLNTLMFMVQAEAVLSKVYGMTIGHDKIVKIRSYLTGDEIGRGTFNVSQFLIRDKHGFEHPVFNSKVNIYQEHSEPIFLGLQNSDLANFEATPVIYKFAA